MTFCQISLVSFCRWRFLHHATLGVSWTEPLMGACVDIELDAHRALSTGVKPHYLLGFYEKLR